MEIYFLWQIEMGMKLQNLAGLEDLTGFVMRESLYHTLEDVAGFVMCEKLCHTLEDVAQLFTTLP